jgi:hypothetical protein
VPHDDARVILANRRTGSLHTVRASAVHHYIHLGDWIIVCRETDDMSSQPRLRPPTSPKPARQAAKRAPRSPRRARRASPAPAPGPSEQFGDCLQWMAGADPGFLRQVEKMVQAQIRYLVERGERSR